MDTEEKRPPIELDIERVISIKQGIDILIEAFFSSTTFENVSRMEMHKIESLMVFSNAISEKIYEVARTGKGIGNIFLVEINPNT